MRTFIHYPFLIISCLIFLGCPTLPEDIFEDGGGIEEFTTLLNSTEGNKVFLSRDRYSSDSTEYIQSVLDSVSDVVIIPAEPGPWYTGPLEINRDDLTILFEPGARLEAREGLFQGTGECLLTIQEKSNISLIGLGGPEGIYMRKKDYQSASYEKGEWRHCLSLKSTENILVQGIVLAESGGDGIYVGQSKKDGVINYCLNTTIRSCLILDNHRQGISVISAENLLVEDTLCWGTRGTLPKAGIDFEPNRSAERLVNCRVIDSRFERNAGPGIHLYLRKLTEESVPLSITLEGNYCRNNLLGIGINLAQLQNNPRGRVTLIDNDFGRSLFNKIPRKKSLEIIEQQGQELDSLDS